MKVIPETIEFDESDILVSLTLYLKSLGHKGEFNIKLNTETKRFPNPHMVGGMADWSDNVIVTATAIKK